MFAGALSPFHWRIVPAIALVTFGPKRAPEIGKNLGTAIRCFREALKGEATTPVAPASRRPAPQHADTPIAEKTAGTRYAATAAPAAACFGTLTGGRVGYLHIPDMGSAGTSQFIKWYYPQIRKEGLIVDVRANGGGNVSQQIIDRLARKWLATTDSSLRDDTGTYPGSVFIGHMVCLLNETSASDGDIFPYMFRQAGLGPLIGKRSWGGVVGISGRGPLIDGGQVFMPLGGMGSVDGRWIIEGHGLDPDVVVENDPAAVAAGHDPQLERGVTEVMNAIAANPVQLPARPPDPVKAN